MAKMECQELRAEALRELPDKMLTKGVGHFKDLAIATDEKTIANGLAQRAVGREKGQPEDSVVRAGNSRPDETMASAGKANRLEKEEESTTGIQAKVGFIKKSPIKIGEKTLETQDPLIEMNLGSDEDKRPTFISGKLLARQQGELIELLRRYKDCFIWSYKKMPGLS